MRLKFHVQAQLDGYDQNHQVGPYFTLHEIAFCDTKTIDGLCASLAKLGLHHFNNENTLEHASIWQKHLSTGVQQSSCQSHHPAP